MTLDLPSIRIMFFFPMEDMAALHYFEVELMYGWTHYVLPWEGFLNFFVVGVGGLLL